MPVHHNCVVIAMKQAETIIQYSVIETRQYKATTPEDSSFFSRRKISCLSLYVSLSSADVLQPSEVASIADALSTLSPGDLASLASAMGFSEEEVAHRRQLCSCSQRDLLLGLLLEYSRRTPYHVKRRLASVLMSSGCLKEAVKLYPIGQ